MYDSLGTSGSGFSLAPRGALLDATKIREELGWVPAHGWHDGLAETVAWYRENRAWWEPLKARAPVEETAAWGSR